MGFALGKSVGAAAGYMCFGNNLAFLAWVLEAHGVFKPLG